MDFNGTVKWFNEAKVCGFIRRTDGPELLVKNREPETENGINGASH
jgi:cold shock CspA family protein